MATGRPRLHPFADDFVILRRPQQPRVSRAHGLAATRRTPPPSKIASRRKPARICCSTSTIRSTGGPGGREAFDEAKRSGKPILLSVGYAACHWCHVMAHESFEDDDTARVMNELFVNIKVDREERPDIDQIYMAALHHLGEHGGWPLTMFLTPAGEPFWGGTYFPKTSRYGKPAFVDVLREIARLFREEPAKIEQNRAALMAQLAEAARPAGTATIGAAELDNAARQLGGIIDPRARRHARRAEISAIRAVRIAVARRAAHRRGALFRGGRDHARPHLRGRHLRPSRRRLLALFGRRALARAALREDALRQRATARAVWRSRTSAAASRSIARGVRDGGHGSGAR